MFAFLFNIQIILAFFPELRTLQQICCRRKRSTSGGCCSGAVLGRPGVPTVSRRQISPFRVWKTTRRKWTSNIETRNSKQKSFWKRLQCICVYIFSFWIVFFCWKSRFRDAEHGFVLSFDTRRVIRDERANSERRSFASVEIALSELQFLGPWTWLGFFLDFWWTFRFRFLSELFCKCSGQCFSGSWRRWPEPEHGGR